MRVWELRDLLANVPDQEARVCVEGEPIHLVTLSRGWLGVSKDYDEYGDRSEVLWVDERDTEPPDPDEKYPEDRFPEEYLFLDPVR